MINSEKVKFLADKFATLKTEAEKIRFLEQNKDVIQNDLGLKMSKTQEQMILVKDIIHKKFAVFSDFAEKTADWIFHGNLIFISFSLISLILISSYLLYGKRWIIMAWYGVLFLSFLSWVIFLKSPPPPHFG